MPRLFERPTWLLFAGVLLLQLVSWWVQKGYPLADAVEYMDRALAWVRGDELDVRTIRSFAYSGLYVPLFALAKVLGIEDLRPLLPFARGIQIVVGLLFIWAIARVGARLGGRSSGYAAGFIAGSNPYFLAFSVWPISGVAAALCIALGLERLLAPTTLRRSLVGGLWLGLGFLMAYQTLLVIMAIAAAILVRDRLKRFAAIGGVALGLTLAIGIQVVLDRLVYAEWGASVWRYLVSNYFSTVTTWLLGLGLREWARALYHWQSDLLGFGIDASVEPDSTRQLFPRTWYLTHFHHMVVLPLVPLFLLGVWRTIRTRNAAGLILLVAFAVNVFVMSFKGAKSFRLWLPLIPMLAPLCALGWSVIAKPGGAASMTRKLAAGFLVLAALPFSYRVLWAENPRYHSLYWDAATWLEGELGRQGERETPVRVGAGYEWAVFLRFSPRVALVKQDALLDSYDRLTPEQQTTIKTTLDTLEWLVVHLPALSNQKTLFFEVSERFRVRAVFYDQRLRSDLGPVYVLERRRVGEHELRFFELDHTDDPERYARENRLGRRTTFVRPLEDREESLSLLGFSVEPVAGSGHQWLTYHWHADTDLSRDYKVIDALTGPDGTNSWSNDHWPAYRVVPTSKWRRGFVLRESHLLVASQDSFYANRPFKPTGGAYRRGDLIPARLWVALIDGARSEKGVPQLEVREPLTGTKPREFVDPVTGWHPRGWRFLPSGRVFIGGLFLPVHPWARVKDDGRPLVD